MRIVYVPVAMITLFWVVLTPVSAPAQTSQGVGVVTTLSGHARVARPSLPQPLPLRFKDDVFERDRISTAETSLVRVLLGGKAIVTVRELSELTITEASGRSTITLSSGKIAVGVAPRRMGPGEALEIRTDNTVAAVRGTVLVVETIATGSADSSGTTSSRKSDRTEIDVQRGVVRITALDGRAMDVAAGKGITLVGASLGPLRDFRPGAFDGLTPTQAPHTGPGADFQNASLARELNRASAMARVVAGTPGFATGGPFLGPGSTLDSHGGNVTRPLGLIIATTGKNIQDLVGRGRSGRDGTGGGGGRDQGR